MTITLSATLFRSIGNVLKNILALTLIDINMTKSISLPTIAAPSPQEPNGYTLAQLY